MLNLFKNKKSSGKSPAKSSRPEQAPTDRGGTRTPNVESKSWFRKPSKSAKKPTKSIQIESISASSPALNSNNEYKKNGKINSRSLSISENDNIVTRGQQTSKLEAQTPEDLSRSSSITNLNVDQKAKGAKPKKADSKDKLDKVVDKKHDKNRALNKNNNKESENNSPDSLSDIDALQKQLAQMANDKSNLALQFGEQTGQLNKLQKEIAHLKMLHEESIQKLEQLLEENTILRNRLRDVAHSPLSDTEKQQLLYESHRHHNSAPASIATNLLEDGGDITTCPTPEWDKYSSSNVSEVSVACLQDKINQMQETHYSTNEELQATLQELTDLQKQLTELQQENLRLNDEKTLMFESLCRQTERLNDSRNEVENLKQLLYKDENGQFETAAEREQKLVVLLKSAQEERETLLVKQEQLGNELEDSRSTNLIHNDEIAQLTERVKTLESTLDAKHAEHKLLDQELAQAKDQSSSRQIEINRLKDLLENARTKINELEQDRTLSDKSELDELLDNARKEKDALESEVAHLKEKLALSKNENEKLKEQLSILQEECKVIRNNAKTTQSDLEYKLEKVLTEKNTLAEQLQQFQEVVNELQVQTQCQLDDKRQLSSVLSETQRNLNESERRIVDLETELSELKKIKKDQEEEWEKFQNDLLTSVRVANDFKTEAQQDLQKLIMENKAGREKIKQLEGQIEKLKGNGRKTRSPHLSNEEILLSSLNRRYKEIEHYSQDQLTEEQKAIKLLKMHYEKDFPRQKPVAHKPKNKLAISKPSLESVILNPKLEEIVSNSDLQNVESAIYFSEDEDKHRSLSPTRISLIDEIGASVDELNLSRNNSFPKVQSDSGVEIVEKFKEQNRSRSLSDLPIVISHQSNLRRYESTDNLDKISKEKIRRKKSTVNLGTLEKICSEINPKTPDSELTKEQRLALRLREVLSNQTNKPTLKKTKLMRKKIVISRPTKESVEQNAKLYKIINDPVIKNVNSDVLKLAKKDKKISRKSKERYSMPVSSELSKNLLKSSKKSRSYNDINFKFQVPNMYSEEEENKTFNSEFVLPPKEFRDISSEEVNSVFKTFQTNDNTFKKEHNYLDDIDNFDGFNRTESDIKFLQDCSKSDISFHKENCTDENFELSVVDFVENDFMMQSDNYDISNDEEMNKSDASGNEKESSEFPFRHSIDLESETSSITQEIYETRNDVIDGRIDYAEVDVFDDSDEEVRKAKRVSRQRYSQVIEQMKEKFENASEDATENVDEDKKLSDSGEALIDNLKEQVMNITQQKSEQSNDKTTQLDKMQESDMSRIGDTELELQKSNEIPDNHLNSTHEDIVHIANSFSYQTNEPLQFAVLQESISSDTFVISEHRMLMDDWEEYDTLNAEDIFENTFIEHRKSATHDSDTDSANSKELSESAKIELFSTAQLPVDSCTNHSNETNDFKSSLPIINIVISPVDDMEGNNANISYMEELNLTGITNPIENLEYNVNSNIPIKQSVNTYIDTEKKINGQVFEEKVEKAETELLQQVGQINKEALEEKVTKKEVELLQNEQQVRDEEAAKGEAKFLQKREQVEKEVPEEELTKEEVELLQHYSKRRSSRQLSDINAQDLSLVDEIRNRYLEDDIKQDHVFPQILSPARRNQPQTYEPVYANFYVNSNRNLVNVQPVIPGKKPVALPRITSMDSDESIYKDFGGQMRKTRFSITYECKKADSFKEDNQTKSAKVKDLRRMFEPKSKSEFSELINKTLLEDDDM